MAQDYYQVLGVDRDASAEEIKKAFREIARRTHPDANPDNPEGEEQFRQAAEAFEILSNPEKRAAYDRGDLNGFGWEGGINISDLLRMAFGAGGMFGGSGSVRQAGEDVGYQLEVSLNEASFGTSHTINPTLKVRCERCQGSGGEPDSEQITCDQCGGAGQIRRQTQSFLGTMVQVAPCSACLGEGIQISELCVDCGGQGFQEQPREITVEVPPGIPDRAQLRLSGRGNAGFRGAPPGDLYIQIEVAPHPDYERHNSHLLYRMTIPMVDAALGITTQIPLLEGGTQKLKIPAGSQPGAVFTLKGKGSHQHGVRRRGDLLVEVSVEIPRKLSKEDKRILEQLRTRTTGERSADEPGNQDESENLVGNDREDHGSTHHDSSD